MMKQVIACCMVISTMLMLSLSAVFACCSLQPAHFSSTKGFTGEALKDGKLVHLLGYQNTVVNTLSSSKPVGNAMFLPIPAKPGTMTEKNVLDTTSYPSCLEDMERAIQPVSRGGLSKGPISQGAIPTSAIVFEHDIYTVVLAANAEDIPAALKQVPEEKRPALNPAIFKAYSKWYPGWTFALCCFNTKQEASAKPLLWWYEPMHPDKLFFPALDAHDGNPPKLGASVEVDHALFASSYTMNDTPTTRRVWYSDDRHVARLAGTPEPAASPLRKLLPNFVIGQKFHQQMANGDFVFKTDDVRHGVFNPARELPPGAGRNIAQSQ